MFAGVTIVAHLQLVRRLSENDNTVHEQDIGTSARSHKRMLSDGTSFKHVDYDTVIDCVVVRVFELGYGFVEMLTHVLHTSVDL